MQMPWAEGNFGHPACRASRTSTPWPAIGDACRIDLLDGQGELQPRLSHDELADHNGRIVEQSDLPAGSEGTPRVLAIALKTGKPSLHPLGEPHEEGGQNIDISALAPTIDVVAACIVPLIARGRTIGTMAVLQAGSSRAFQAEDGSLIGELAQRAALALDNALLLSEARKAQREAEAANHAKDEFLAMLGYELRNPPTPIVLALKLIARRDASAFPKEREISGYELARQVRSQPDTQSLPLVALTGYGSDSDRRLALEAGFDDHFSKPVDMGRLLERPTGLLAGRHERDAALRHHP